MLDHEQIKKLKAKRLCRDCVGESYLSDEIATEGKRLKCSYCGSFRKCYRLNQLAERIEEVFEQHFVRTATDPDPMQYAMMADRESDYSWERDGEQAVYAIMNAADIPEVAAQDIQKILEDKHYNFDAATSGEETQFDSDSYYEAKGASDAAWQEEWRSFDVNRPAPDTVIGAEF